MKNSHRRSPLPGAPEMSGAMLIPANTYGDRAPFGSVEGRRARKERLEAVHTGRFFTQLRAARMRKTLLLLVCVY